MAHPKSKLKHPRYRELKTVRAGRSRRRLLMLSERGIGRNAVHAFTGLSSSGLRKIKNGSYKYVYKETQALIFSVPFNAFSDRAVIDATETQELIDKLLDEGFTKSELARRLNPRVKAKRRPGHASLQLGRKGHVIARTQMRVEKFYNKVMAEAAA